jgi:hypothetical protein
MKTIHPFILFFLCWNSYSQTAPSIAWQKLIGGNNDESPCYFANTYNNSIYIASSSNSSISGDKSQNCRGEYDYWLVKTDENGNLIWDKTMGAGPVVLLGPASDIVTSVYETTDGNVLMGGFSNSNISGEKTEVCRGDYDFWLLKLNGTNGSILWDKTIGGDTMDFLTAFIETSDGNYLAAGSSLSSNTGDKNSISRGGADIWLIKLNSNGTTLWQKSIGGSGYDTLNKIIQTQDGGFILLSTSASPISGEKTENSFGSSDYWVVKLDENGTIQWQKTIGGIGVENASQIIKTEEGGYLIGGSSNSNTSGLKTENSRGSYDFWLLKLDSTGNIEWQKTIGGNADDTFTGVYQCMDLGYIMVGTTLSNISGDKSENIVGFYDAWVIKLDENGVMQWQKDIGGIDYDGFDWVKQFPDGSFLLGGNSSSSNSFDVTATNHGSNDLWLVKLNSESLNTTAYDSGTLALYPNPAQHVLTIETQNHTPISKVVVYDLIGKKVLEQQGNVSTVVVENLAQGMYCIEIYSENRRLVQKFIKE